MIINRQNLAKYSILPINYNYDEVLNYVDIAEKIWILPILGYDWYDELQEQVLENKVSEENATALVSAIWPYLGCAIVYEALPTIWLHASEIGLTRGKSDNSESASLKDLAFYQEHIRKQLEAHKDFCKKWICEHLESFPLANPCNCNCDCCKQAELNHPNPLKELYSTRRQCTDLK